MEKKSGSNFCSGFTVIGFPDEIGIANVKGRLGAKAGPDSFLTVFGKMNGVNPVRERMIGSELVQMGSVLEQNYESARTSISRSATHSLVVAIGGGHDYAYPWFSGLLDSMKSLKGRLPKVGCINIDAHFDLRSHQPIMTSGSPFRRLIEEGILSARHLVEFGIQDHCNATELWTYAKQKQISTIPMTRLRNGKAVAEFKKALNALRKKCDQVVISLDLDAVSLAYCPGVSAPQAEGFSASEIFQMLEIAGSDKKVTSLGVFELAPSLDHQDQTSRVAAQAVWHFLNSKFFPSKKS